MNPTNDTHKMIRKLALCLVLLVGLITVFTVVNQAYATGGGNALDFDGTFDALNGDYVVAGFNPATDLGQTFTIEAWVNLHDDGIHRGIAGDHGGVAQGIFFGQDTDAWGGWGFGGGDGSEGSDWFYATVPSLPLNQWTHIAAVYVGNAAGPGGVTVYLNGELAAQSNWTNRTFSHLTTFYIGRAYNAYDRFFDGQIDDFRVWTTARTAEEIEEAKNPK